MKYSVVPSKGEWAVFAGDFQIAQFLYKKDAVMFADLKSKLSVNEEEER